VFSIDTSFTHLAASRDQVLVLLQSINAISAKVPGHQAQPATGYIAAWDVGNGQASAVIYLHFTGTARAAAYGPDPKVFAVTELPRVTEEASEFLESMGYMLDDSAFGTLPPEQQERLVAAAPLFHADLKVWLASRESDDELPEAELVELDAEVIDEEPSAPPTAATTGAEALPRDAVGRLLMSF